MVLPCGHAKLAAARNLPQHFFNGVMQIRTPHVNCTSTAPRARRRGWTAGRQGGDVAAPRLPGSPAGTGSAPAGVELSKGVRPWRWRYGCQWTTAHPPLLVDDAWQAPAPACHAACSLAERVLLHQQVANRTSFAAPSPLRLSLCCLEVLSRDNVQDYCTSRCRTQYAPAGLCEGCLFRVLGPVLR